MSNTVMLVHGAWLPSGAWDPCRRRYQGLGYNVVTPPWPLEDEPDVPAGPALGRVVDHYASLIRALSDPPIIMGHSRGGLITQLLLEQGLGVAGVALGPEPIRGMIPPARRLVSVPQVVRSRDGGNRVRTVSLVQCAVNIAPVPLPAEMHAACDPPVTGTASWRNGYGTAIGSSAGLAMPDRAPLLLIAGGEDRVIAPSMVRATYLVQPWTRSVTGFKSFPGRPHFPLAEAGWEEVADYAIAWAIANQPGQAGGAHVHRFSPE